MPDNSDRIGSARRTAELLAPLPAKLPAEGPCPGEVAKKNATRELRGWRNFSAATGTGTGTGAGPDTGAV